MVHADMVGHHEERTARRDSRSAPQTWLLTSLSVLAVLVTGSCAERIPEPVLVPSVPHVSWVIASQTREGQERTICQSDPRTDCVLSAGLPDAPAFATVHLYLHPAKRQETKYSGTMQVGFMNGSAAEAHDTNINSTVKAGETPTNVSVTGIVTQQPGVYAVSVAVVATSAASKGEQSIRETISVKVK